MCVCVLFLFVVVVLFFVLFCVCSQRVVFATNVFAPSLLLLRAQKTPAKRDPLDPGLGDPGREALRGAWGTQVVHAKK